MSENVSPTVCLDGSSVRRIREEKNLTQLYVAKVVGVTTDTISRWENNRYPTIKRSNAIRLADALDVDLESVLRSETEDEEAEEITTKSWQSAPWGIGILLVGFVLGLWYFSSGEKEETTTVVRAQRLLPTFAAPGATIPVRVRLDLEGEMKGFILREHFPKGWKMIEASPPPSSLDNVEGIARWIIKSEQMPSVITYRIQAAPEASQGAIVKFIGEVVANPRGYGQVEIVSGGGEVKVDYYHWADSDGDEVIADWEVLRASDTVDEMKKIHLDWDVIEAIWDAGGYQWNTKAHRFVPVRVSPPPSPEP